MRFGKYRSDEKVLHDEYFGEQPSAVFLLTVRLVLLCLMSASFIMVFCDIYGFTGSSLIPVVTAAVASGLIYLLASLLPPAIVYGAVIAAAGGILWVLRDRVITYASYFWDYLMLRLDSRLLHTSEYFIHDRFRITAGSGIDLQLMERAFFYAAILLAVLCAVFFTAAVRTRFRISVPAIAITVISAPAIAAEVAGYVPSYLLFVISVFGFEAVSSSYELDSGFIFGSLTSAHLSDMRGDREHRRYVSKLSPTKRAESDTERYHRYSGNMIAMTFITAAVFFGAAAVIPPNKGINYKQVFDTLTTIGTKAADSVGELLGISLVPANDKGYFSSDSFGDISGSISIQPPGDSDRAVLDVTVSRNDVPVYLRGDIGVDYTGGAWTSVSASADRYRALVAEDFYPEAEYQVYRRYIAWKYADLSPEDALPLQMVTARYIRNTRVVFQPLAPYELSYKTSPVYDFFGDFILRTKTGFVKNYDGLALTPYISDRHFRLDGEEYGGRRLVREVIESGSGSVQYALENELIAAPDISNGHYLEQIRAYRGFIEETYMTKPDIPAISELTGTLGEYYISSEWDRLMSESVINDNEFRFIRATEICDYFRENFTYSLTADNGEDPLNGFLTDTHSGHCALFATAMTLALRDIGIPARYVTGYVIYPGTPYDNRGGFRTTLTEKQLHAWTEVYFRGIGWLPFDPTAEVPGYAETVFGDPDKFADRGPDAAVTTSLTEAPPVTSETSSSTSQSTTAPDDTPDTGETDESADTTQPAPGGNGGSDSTVHSGGGDLFLRLLPIIVIMLVIVAIAVVTVLFFRSLAAAEKRTLNSFSTLPPTEAVSIMYRFVMTLLETKDLVPGNEQFYDFAERVDGSIEMKGLNYFMMDVMPTFEKCEFSAPGTEAVSEDERAAVLHYTSAVYGKVMDDLSYFKRIFMKMSLFL